MPNAASSLAGKLRNELHELLIKTCKTSWVMFRIMVPVSIVTKILNDIGAVALLGRGLAPLMRLVGLPPDMGIVWGATLVTNLYGGIAAFVSLSSEHTLTAAQVTTLATMMLVAHALPVELRIAQRAGARVLPMLLLRVLGAFLLGICLHQLYSLGGWLQQPGRLALSISPLDPSWMAWAVSTVKNLAFVFVVILALLFLMRILEKAGITRLMTRLLEPLLEHLGMSQAAAPLAIIGVTLGITYGAGLIITETRAGHLTQRDVFFSLAFMAICHALIEDTFLMISLGAHISGVFWARLVFGIIVIALVVKTWRGCSDAVFDRWFYRPLPNEAK